MRVLVALAMMHRALIVGALWWLYSAGMATLPPLSANAGWLTRWVHDWAQYLAANPNKITRAVP